MKYFIFFLVIFSSIISFAQVQELNLSNLEQFKNEIKNNNNLNPGTEGTGFIYESFVLASLNNNLKLELVRFNLLDDKIEVRVNDEEVQQLSNEGNFKVKVKNGSNRIFETQTYCSKLAKCRPEKSFFEELYRNKEFAIFFKENVVYYKAQTKLAGYDERKAAKFVPAKGEYYITNFISNSGNLIKIPNKKSKLLKMLDEYSKPLDLLISSENLNIENSADLIIIFSHYFQLKLKNEKK